MTNTLPRIVREDATAAAPIAQRSADTFSDPVSLNATSPGGTSMSTASLGESSFNGGAPAFIGKPLAEMANGTATKPQERRKHRRTCIRLSVRVRPANSQDGYFEEILETVNSSRGGLKFITTSGRFYPGMRILTTFPYSCNHDRVTGAEENGVIERLEAISDKALGVAVRLTKSGSTGQMDARVRPYASHSTPAAQTRKGTERRLSVRKPFSASATAVEENSETRLQVRCSDLCLDGCYVDTLNPFPEGTLLQLRIKNKEAEFETPARVCSTHIGMGMGLMFCETAEEQKAILAEWLGEKNREFSYR